MPRLFTAISKAAVPLETQQEKFLLVNFASSFSNLLIFKPLEDTHPLFTVLKTSLASLFVIIGMFTGMNLELFTLLKLCLEILCKDLV